MFSSSTAITGSFGRSGIPWRHSARCGPPIGGDLRQLGDSSRYLTGVLGLVGRQ